MECLPVKPFSLVSSSKTAEKDELIRYLTVSVGDPVITEVDNGYDLGLVTLTGELVRFQMKKKNITQDSEEVSNYYAKLTNRKLTNGILRDKEPEIQKRARELALGLGLEMKLSDVEFQGDGKRLRFIIQPIAELISDN